MFVVPMLIPVTTPLTDPIVALDGTLLLHVPPEVVFAKVVV
jgi:hypothetical protein